MALLECKNVSLAYEGKTIVSGLDFKVEKGDYLCIVGENGSGKTTLMKTLVGLKSASGGE
ncbi:MAG: ABC transporter ATP-binding protein, partial [Clostridia bacterium]|nr:ABC transporter ATP-binding protein [Clostridia bacterium]